MNIFPTNFTLMIEITVNISYQILIFESDLTLDNKESHINDI